MAENERKVQVTDFELRAAFSGPAVLSNKMYCTAGPFGVRIAFMEQIGDKVSPQFRAAVTMSREDAVALRGIIEQVLSFPLPEKAG